MIAVVIMAGGKGERFWPKSRIERPKQFINLINENTMLQETFSRLMGFVEPENVYISTGDLYVDTIKEQLPYIPKENIIVEPVGRNTAPCIGLAALHIAKKDKNATMVVLPSDHLIKNRSEFINTLKKAVSVAERGENLVTLGITPNQPETGYGYINFDDNYKHFYGDNVYKVNKFVEKPDYSTACYYVETGTYLWNSGMFIWNVRTIFNNFKKYLPDHYKRLLTIEGSLGTDEYKEVLDREYNQFESISIDYGIMEHAENIYVLPGIFGWDDVGSWTALNRIHSKDINGNVVKGKVVSLDTNNCIIEANDKLIATIGLNDVVVVDSEDAILICDKNNAQDVKKILTRLKEDEELKYL
ncbi:mannose-1-phosphate guanylyltransferase [Vallitalea okinawensis]|uniref:mannose-1-phosphate guanylyltransferase n=1 Tax=Vallitalea okinawensis TaxID=2078660 RepID=UPI000CFC4FF2|nr:mannose-1-phosphate guanylyltransferase [Vallitalea okinawensis]